jgi:uncharacterized protein (DUF427 family)
MSPVVSINNEHFSRSPFHRFCPFKGFSYAQYSVLQISISLHHFFTFTLFSSTH